MPKELEGRRLGTQETGSHWTKKGYGQAKAEKLIEILDYYVEKGETNTYHFQESLAILCAYCEFQTQSGVNIDSIIHRVEKLKKHKNKAYFCFA